MVSEVLKRLQRFHGYSSGDCNIASVSGKALLFPSRSTINNTKTITNTRDETATNKQNAMTQAQKLTTQKVTKNTGDKKKYYNATSTKQEHLNKAELTVCGKKDYRERWKAS